jgi:hypothetical protein
MNDTTEEALSWEGLSARDFYAHLASLQGVPRVEAKRAFLEWYYAEKEEPGPPVPLQQRDPELVIADIAQIAFTEASNPAVAMVRIRKLLFPGYVERADFVDDLTREIARLTHELVGDGR